MMFVKEFNYCRLPTKNTFLNSLRFLCSIRVLQATTPLHTEPHERLTALLTNFTALILQNTQCFGCKHRGISGHFFKNHRLSKSFVALLPIYCFLASSLSSLELQLSRQRNVFLQARMNNLNPITEPCVGYEQFSRHKRKEGICYPYINKLKQVNLQMERIKVSVWVTSKLIPSRNVHHLHTHTHRHTIVTPVPPRAKSQAQRMHLPLLD